MSASVFKEKLSMISIDILHISRDVPSKINIFAIVLKFQFQSH